MLSSGLSHMLKQAVVCSSTSGGSLSAPIYLQFDAVFLFFFFFDTYRCTKTHTHTDTNLAKHCLHIFLLTSKQNNSNLNLDF